MNKKTTTRIHAAVDQLFERMKDKFLGARLVDKQLALTTDRPDLTLSGLAVSSAASEGAVMTPQSLNSLMHIAGSYLDAAKERAKAEVVASVAAFKLAGADPDVALGGALSATWEKITNDVIRIVDTEAQRGRTLGAIEGITAINLAAGVEDPTMFFVVVRDGHRCSECTRLHLLDDGVTPRVWKMSEVGTGYHKKGDPNPKAHGLHPHCRCSPATLLPGYGFDASGMVKYITPGHDEFKKQRG